MSNIKLHEATKQFKLSNKVAMYFLETIHMPVKSHSSVITFDQLELLRELSQDPAKYKEINKAYIRSEEEKKQSEVAGPSEPELLEPVSEPTPVKKPETPPPPATEKKPDPIKPTTEVIVNKSAPKKPETLPEKPVPAPPKEEIKKEAPHRTVPVPPTPIKEEKHLPPPPTKPKTEPPPPSRMIPPQRKMDLGRQNHPKYPRPHGQRGPHYTHSKKPEYIPKPPKPEVVYDFPPSIDVPDLLTARELAEKLGCRLKVIEDKMAFLKLAYQSNEFMDIEDIQKLCQELKIEARMIPFEDYLMQQAITDKKAQLKQRPPVVTVMGHVDHGKTTLLDTLRKTRVAEKEAGGITQKIGAYKISTKEGEIVFIDTPGHEAFTNLRARGAQVTDIVILMVAANDGIQPQTIEAIQHARAAKVPMIVAINKIDLPGASADKIKQDLTKHNVLVEDWGGDVVSVQISAKHNQNLDNLLEMIQLVSQLQELKAYTDIPARGTIIESRLDPQLGPIGTVLIQHGRLRKGDQFICGNAVGKTKSLFDHNGLMINEATVPDPVEVMGFTQLPNAGDTFQVVDNLEKAERVISSRQIKEKDARTKDILTEKKMSFQNLFQLLEQNKIDVFPVIIKADNFGSSEVLEQLLQKQSQEKLKIEIIFKGIGNITESDILLASTTNALILGFNVKAPQKILPLAKRENVEIRLYSVIYHLIEEITKAIQGKIAPEYEDILIGKAQVLQKFKISRVGFVAGCMVQEGKVTRKSKIKVIRGTDLVFEGELESLKRVKDEVSEVKAGIECGIKIKNFNNIEPDDILEIYETQLKK